MSLRVLFMAAELTPLAKVGGLSDVVGALPQALRKIGVDARIVIPKYNSIEVDQYPMKRLGVVSDIPFNNRREFVTVYEAQLPGTDAPVYLIDHPQYLSEGGIYFEHSPKKDDPAAQIDRFLFFSRSCLALPKLIDFSPDVLHVHDWHAAIVPALLPFVWGKAKRPACVLTVHNLALQGVYNEQYVRTLLELPKRESLHPKNGEVNCLREGILTTDMLTTVSPTYAKEMLTPEYGCGLEQTIAERQDALVGILNGIDTTRFNPATDPALAARYSAVDVSGKMQCKSQLQKLCGFHVQKNTPLLGMVSRLTDQKGIDLILVAIKSLVKRGAQIVLLGSGEQRYEEAFTVAAQKYRSQVFARIGFFAPFAQKIYAGADILLMPSRFEPCGLSQMIAMRYGTVPVVRATGGLRDTVSNLTADGKRGEGFSFDKYDISAFEDALNRALKLYADNKAWYTIQQRIMKRDFSWESSAKQYLSVYHQAIKKQ